jgi:integrase
MRRATGRCLFPGCLNECLSQHIARAGPPRLRFHDLRHTAATLLLARGIHVKVVQELLGHSSSTLALDAYSHVLPPLQDEAADQMQAFLARRD